MYEFISPKFSGAGRGVLTQQLALLKELTVRIHEDEKNLEAGFSTLSTFASAATRVRLR